MNDIEKLYEQMYEFENNSRLYNFRFKDTGIPMWVYIRSYFIRNIINKRSWHQSKNVWKAKENSTYIKKSFIRKYVTKNPFFTSKKDIIFAFWGYSELRQHDGGQVFEDFIMPYLQTFSDNTTTLMDGKIRNKYELDCTHPEWKMDDVFLDILKYIRYIKKTCEISIEDRKNIKDLITFLNQNCPLQIDNILKREIIYNLEFFAKNSKQMINIFEIYLQKVNPKVVIVCCASYPDILRTSMILACKNKKVVTAELQHGVVSTYHENYHYGNNIINNKECSKILPDYFLTFGEYWNREVRIPSKCNVVGYAKTVIVDKVPSDNNILFCAGANFDAYMEFLNGLMPELHSETKIYFRLHPIFSTKEQRNRFKKFLKYPNFFTADEKDLSFYMKDCRYVIVDGSTVCYEALFMGRIVFAFESDASIQVGISKLPFVYLFNNSDNFIKLWNKRDKMKSEYHSEFFDINYKENYIKFLRKCGVKTSTR